MSKLAVVVGATGTQGGSVVDALLQDPTYRVRGLTRNPESDAAKALAAKGAEIVPADLNDESSLVAAFKGANAIFAITNFFEPAMKLGVEEGKKVEFAQATNMIKAAKLTPTLEHYIWSTLPNANALSKGKFSVPFFDNKSAVDDYIRQDKEFLAKTTFLYLTFYSSNVFFPVYLPIHVKSVNKYIQTLPAAPDTPISSLSDARQNVGIFARAVFNNRARTTGGTYVLGSVEDLTLQSYLAAWGKGTGISPAEGSTEVLEISLDKYRTIWPGYGDLMGEMTAFWGDLREKSWTTPLGTQPVKVQELLSEADAKQVVSTVDGFKGAAEAFKSAL
ncbi:hypothetical protein BJY01DRAFT_213776 [Aspergillus pseudoustus]|uniref:NmrA-like domain-containing protein n=1 Tax=Aspergillus pseudoustus TaxID=1810923 RepID=A0ABR4K1N6_9EURO